MSWNWKIFFHHLLKRVISDFRISSLVGLGILFIFTFVVAVFSLGYSLLDQFGQVIAENSLKLLGYPINLPSGAGFLTTIIIGILFGKFLTTKWGRDQIDWILFKIPLFGWAWKQIRNFQTGFEQLKNYKAVRTTTFYGKKELFLVKRIKWERIKLLDGSYKDEGWKAEGFLPSINNPTSGRAFISVDLATIDAKICNPIEEIMAYVISCTISAPDPDWIYEEIDWKKDFGIDIKQKPLGVD